MIGRTISRYRIVSELGAGGMGRVFRAEDALLGRPVALKFPRRELVHDEAARARFLREARVASVLDHPNIVVLYDVGEADGEIFLAMQCIEGRSLRERLRAGPPPLAEILATGRAVADALAHAHARGVVHRDVKPENILLCSDGRVKVADFGLALAPGESRLTMTGTFVGTPAYVAPEVVRGAEATARSDLYSLGAVLHELVSGRPPFSADHLAALTYRIAHEEPAPLPSGTPPDLQRLVRSLLAKGPDQRPTSAVAVADALLALASGQGAPTPATAAPRARSIAVLPFENLTGNARDDYLCNGITEDLLTDILKIPDLQVASRGLVGGRRSGAADVRDIGRDLSVATVLEGGVRRAGDRIRVTARLARTDSGYQLWAERYDQELQDVFEVQEDIARRIATALRVVFEPEDPEGKFGRRTRSPRAYDLRLRALAHYRRFEEADMRRAIALLEEAVREDPEYALGRADLAESYVQMVCKEWELDPAWLDRAEAEVERAVRMAPSLPEAYRASGHVWAHRHKLNRALRDFHHAVDLDPRFTDGLLKLASTYLFLGDASRAEVYMRRACSTDPEDARLLALLAAILLRQLRCEECREVARKAITLQPVRLYKQYALRAVVLSYAREGRTAEAQRAASEARQEFGEAEPFVRALSALAAAFDGKSDAARRWLDPEPGPGAMGTHVRLDLARTYVLLGDREAALAALERARDLVDLDELRTDPQLSTLVGDPRFQSILAANS